jgi:hypothetical protein
MSEKDKEPRGFKVDFGLEESPDTAGVEMVVYPNGRGWVKLYRRAGHPLSIPIPWREGEKWASSEDG